MTRQDEAYGTCPRFRGKRVILLAGCCGLALLVCARPVPVAGADLRPDAGAWRQPAPSAQAAGFAARSGPEQERESARQQETETLEEIVVTARRREETLQSVPLSVSALTDQDVQDLQADDLTGIQYAVPNLYLDRGDASNAVIFLRGIGQNDSLAFVDPGVSIYIDDVYIARTQAAMLELFDVERVEVLRGPQGTLYGRNSPGGAVKLVTRAPAAHNEFYLETGYGRFDDVTARARISGPLSETVKGKLAVSYRSRDGFSRNAFTGRRDGDVRTLAWRAGLYYEPRADLRFVFTLDGRVDRPDTSKSPVRRTTLVAFPDPFADPTDAAVFAPATDNYAVETNANDFSDITTIGLALRAEWQLSADWQLESISAFRTFDFNLELDTDGSPLSVLDVVLFEDSRTFTQELRFVYDDADSWSVTGGLFFFHDIDHTLAGFDLKSAAVFGFPVVLFGFPVAQLGKTDQRADSYALYLDATHRVTARLSVEAGLRYTLDEKRSRRQLENFFDPDFLLADLNARPAFLAGSGIPTPQLRGKKRFSALTPRVALSYDLGDDAMVYASVARGFKSGGFDGRANSAFQFQPFRPEKVWAFEGGLKSQWAARRVTANLAYFYNRYRDLQVTSFGRDPATGFFQSLFTNAAAARIQGVEFELSARPFAGFLFQGSVGFMDAEYRRFDALVGGVPTDVSGRRLVNTPKWSAHAGFTYTHSLGSRLDLTWHLDGNYRGRVANELTDSPNLAQGAYLLINAYAAVSTADGAWELQLGGTNLSDRQYIVQGFNLAEFPGVETAFFGPRRVWGAKLIVRR